MLYEFPVREKDVKGLRAQHLGERSMTVFKLPDEKYKKTSFILMHGTENGLVETGNAQVNLATLLSGLIQNTRIKDMGIEQVYVLCCYGGKQQSAEVDGIKIDPMLENESEIHTSIQYTMDDGPVIVVQHE